MLIDEPFGTGRPQELAHFDRSRLAILLTLPAEPRASEPSRGRKKHASRNPAEHRGERRVELVGGALFLPKMLSFAFSVIGFLTHVRGSLHFPKGFRFLAFIWLPNTGCRTRFFVAIVQFLSVFPFNTFVDRLAEKHASPHQPKVVPICPAQCDNIDTRFFGAHLLCSQRQSLEAFPD